MGELKQWRDLQTAGAVDERATEELLTLLTRALGDRNAGSSLRAPSPEVVKLAVILTPELAG
jgi:hypothetical protein